MKKRTTNSNEQFATLDQNSSTDSLHKDKLNNTPSTDDNSFKFLTVEEFFEDNGQTYRGWNKLEKVENYELLNSSKLVFTFNKPDKSKCLLIIRFPSPYTFRLRFNPSYSKTSSGKYPKYCTRYF